MPLLSFTNGLAARVASGEKRQTIRAPRRRPFQVGEALYLYANVYKPSQWLIGCATCSEVQRVVIKRDMLLLDYRWYDSPITLDAFAREDGIDSWERLVQFFGRELPFEGVLIKWPRLWTADELRRAFRPPVKRQPASATELNPITP